MDLKERIKSIARRNAGKVIAMRRHIHSHPELSYEEYKTADYIADSLRDLGIHPKEGVANTGVTAFSKSSFTFFV